MCFSILIETSKFRYQSTQSVTHRIFFFVCLQVGPRHPGLNLGTKLVMLRIERNEI